MRLNEILESDPKGCFYNNEAKFALPYIQELISSDVNTVLEVGCGPGVLLSMLASSNPRLILSGIEPADLEWGFFSSTLDKICKNYSLEVFRGKYEDYSNDIKFDLIYLINVYEHLPNHNHFLKFIRSHLSPNGKCLILCPNYSFPYEPHFKIPILINKFITYKIFKKFINNYELLNKSMGLWDNLNFVTSKGLIEDAISEGLNIQLNQKIIRDMILRLNDDKEFYSRQKIIGFFSKIALRLGLIKLFESNRLMQFNPYIMATISLR